MSYVTCELTSRELRRHIIENFIETGLGFGEFGGTCGESSGAVWYHTGLAHPFLNGVIGARISSLEPGRVIRECLDSIGAGDVPFAWVVGPDDRPTNLADLLEKAGMAFAFELRGMLLDLQELPEAFEAPEELSVEAAEPGKSFDDLIEVEHKTLSENDVLTEFLRGYYGHMLTTGNKSWRHFVGYADGRAVACSSLFLNGTIAGIYNVGTLEKHRKCGYGTALTTLPLLQARDEGYRWAVLHSSPLGLPVYKRIGFEDICSLRIYLPEGAMQGGN